MQRTNRLAPVLDHAEELEREVKEWLIKRQGEGARLYIPKLMDRVRLLRLEVWATKHHISLSEVLDFAVPAARNMVKSKDKAKKQARVNPKAGLGVTVSTLTGKVVGTMLSAYINQTYPDSEHVAAWRERERELQLAREQEESFDGLQARSKIPLYPLDSETVDEFIKQYQERAAKKRTTMREACGEKWRRRKSYPSGNPWL